MIKQELDSIIRNDELQEFLLGEGPKYSNIYPEVDYQRWAEVAEYYRDLDADHPDRLYIEEKLFALLQSDSPFAIALALETFTSINFYEIEPHLISLLESLDLLEQDERIWISASRAIVRLRLNQAISVLVPLLIEHKALGFLFKAPTDPLFDSRPKDAEIWIIQQLSESYKKGSRSRREDMNDALRIVMDSSKRAQRGARGYLIGTSGEDSRFRELLKSVIPSEDI